MKTRSAVVLAATLCVAACGLGGPPEGPAPLSRPGPNAVAPVSPADRLRVGSVSSAVAAAPAEAAPAPVAAAAAAAPAAVDTAAVAAQPAAAAPPAVPVAESAAAAPAAPAPAAPAAAPSLYDRLGGASAIAIVVDTFTARVHGDTALAPLFRGTDMDHFKQVMRELICQNTGGGCTYTGRPMAAAHAGLNITDAQFDTVVGYLAATLDQFNVPAQEKNELLSILGGMRGDIVGH